MQHWIEVEQTATLPILRLSFDASPAERSALHPGPLASCRALHREIATAAHLRCHAAGHHQPIGRVGDWSATLQLPPVDLEIVSFALDALLAGDPDPIRSWVAHPPPLRELLSTAEAPDP